MMLLAQTLQAAATAGCAELLPVCNRLLQLLSHARQPLQLSQHGDALHACPASSAQPPPAAALPLLQQLSTTPLQLQLCRGLRTHASRSPGSTSRQQQRQQQDMHDEDSHQQHGTYQQQQRQGPTPAALTNLIIAADSPRQLLERVVGNANVLNHIHIIAALARAAELWQETAALSGIAAADVPGASHIQGQQQQPQPGENNVQPIGRQQLQRLMQQLSGPFVRALPQYSTREVSAALASYANCGLQPPMHVMDACVQHLVSWDKIQQAKPDYVARLAWAAVKLNCKDKQLFSHIAAAGVSSGLQQYTAPQLSQLAWAFAASGHHDRALGLTLTARAVELLTRQLQRQQQGQQGQRSGRKEARAYLFRPGHLSGLLHSCASAGWLAETPELLQLAAELSQRQRFADGLTPQRAANLLWAFTTSLRGSHNAEELQQHDGAGSNGSSSSVPQGAEQAGAADSSVPDPQTVWAASLCSATAALRSVDEADAGSLCRLVWSLATLSNWVRSRLLVPAAEGMPADFSAAQEAVADGAVVFNQLCTALGRHWQQQPSSFAQTAALAAWGLLAADSSRLWEVTASVAQRPPSTLQPQQPQQQERVTPTAPTQLLQQLLQRISASGKAAGHQLLPAGTISDLATALLELRSRLQADTWSWASGSTTPVQQGPEGGVQQEQQGLSLGVQLLAELDAAVEALAAAAWQHAGTPGALEVRGVARMLIAFSQLQVDDTGLYHDLLQHWSQEALQGCDSKSLVLALRAADVFTTAAPELVQSGGHAWEHLLEACSSRWASLSAAEAAKARGCLARLNKGLDGVVPPELLQGLAAKVVPGDGC